jgi:hypothetical protein
MKILDVINVKIPNAFKDKKLKKVAYKKSKSVYGIDSLGMQVTTDGNGATDGTAACDGGQ